MSIADLRRSAEPGGTVAGETYMPLMQAAAAGLVTQYRDGFGTARYDITDLGLRALERAGPQEKTP